VAYGDRRFQPSHHSVARPCGPFCALKAVPQHKCVVLTMNRYSRVCSRCRPSRSMRVRWARYEFIWLPRGDCAGQDFQISCGLRWLRKLAELTLVAGEGPAKVRAAGGSSAVLWWDALTGWGRYSSPDCPTAQPRRFCAGVAGGMPLVWAGMPWRNRRCDDVGGA